MGNLIGKHHSDDEKKKSKRHGKHGKRNDRDRHEKRHRHHHGHREDHNQSRWSSYPPDMREYHHPILPVGSYNPYYYYGPASRNWHHDFVRPPMTTVAEQRHKPSSSGSCVSSHYHKYARASQSRYDPSYRTGNPSSLPCTESPKHLRSDTHRQTVSGSRRYQNSALCRSPFLNSARRRPPSGSYGFYRSPCRGRVPSSFPDAAVNESHRKRGMVVYRNRNEEKMKILDSDENASEKRFASEGRGVAEANLRGREYTIAKENTVEEVAVLKENAHRRKTNVVNSGETIGRTKTVRSNEPPVVTHEKKTILNKFWSSPLGKKLPIGGPLSWFRPRSLQTVSEKVIMNSSTRVVRLRPKPRSIWSGLRRRFLWKNSSSQRRPSTRCPDGQESDPPTKVTPSAATPPCEPRSVSRYAPSRQYVWKTASSPFKSVTDDDLEVLNLRSPQSLPEPPSPHRDEYDNDNVFEEEILPKSTRWPNSPFFSSRFTWQRSNTKQTTQAWNQAGLHRTQRHDTSQASCSSSQRNIRSYLWKSNNVKPFKQPVDGTWMSESVLYHH